MTVETDEMALMRASDDSGVPFEWKGPEIEKAELREIYTVFFVYTRINRDGTVMVTHYFHNGKNNPPIDPSADQSVPNSLGYYARDMALFARPGSRSDLDYGPPTGEWLEDLEFPPHLCYCIFYMDDVHWKFLETHAGVPVVKFWSRKNGEAFAKHKHAFGKPELLRLRMPNNRTGLEDERQAVAMINRMRNANDVPLQTNEKERFCFDLYMRVHYAGSTAGLTLIIDPTGTNLGPLKPPP